MTRSGLRILCWEGYEHPRFLAPFAERHNVTASGEHFLSDADAATRVAAAPAGTFDIVNLNTPYAQMRLHPDGLVAPLDPARLDPGHHLFPELLAPLYRAAHTADQTRLLGIGQRFGPFNLVINADRISPDAAADQGFALPADPLNVNRYGILLFPDFNILHMCIAAGLDPFRPLAPDGLAKFSATAAAWSANARLVTGDHNALNHALVRGDIDFYLSGGRFTCAAARLAGAHNIQAVTPRRGPLDGKGAIMFMETTSVVASSRQPAIAEAFLDYLLEPGTAHAIACHEETCNPVVQMSDMAAFDRFSRAELDAIQWDTLEEELSRCVAFDIPPDAGELGRLWRRNH